MGAANHNKLDAILASATQVFCQKGYEGASIRDIAERSGVSLAGLYYYMESKQQLLYRIQNHCFSTLISRFQEQARGHRDPEARLRLFIRNHLEYFLQNPEAMKVLSHEAESLGPPYAGKVAELKRTYYRTCLRLLEELKREKRLRRLDPRLAALSLFGMVNWIYTWYNPRVDPQAQDLAEKMAAIFFSGVLTGAAPGPRNHRARAWAGS